jgi:hypothetical protein
MYESLALHYTRTHTRTHSPAHSHTIYTYIHTYLSIMMIISAFRKFICSHGSNVCTCACVRAQYFQMTAFRKYPRKRRGTPWPTNRVTLNCLFFDNPSCFETIQRAFIYLLIFFFFI